MTERDALTVRVAIPAPMVDPAMLERFAKAMKDLTSGASSASWAFTRLSVGSLDTAARPMVATEDEVQRELDGLAQGLAALEAGRLPRGWNREALSGIETLDGLAEVVMVGVGARFSHRPLSQIAEQAKSLLKVELPSLGSLEGVIDSVSLRGTSPRFGMIDATSGKAVTVSFAQHFESPVLAFFHDRTRVLARGRLFRDAAGAKQRMTLSSLRALDAPTNLSVHDVVGALGDLPKGVDSVEWIRRQRG
ncbi:hypothetical protein ACO0LV_09165 [Pseudactinotalea sp. Z1739]|uniref:hypothetical protein n=1 Tax=Pseudactinotalea sp. Z1739 TaxID=3413028 RepID=UPI003C7B00CD